MTTSRLLLVLAGQFALLAIGTQTMAYAVDANDPDAARTVFAMLLFLGGCAGWTARDIAGRWWKGRKDQ